MLERFKKTPPLEEEPKIDNIKDIIDVEEVNQSTVGEVKTLEWNSSKATDEFRVALQKEHDALISRIDELADEVKNTVLEKERLKKQEVDMAKEATSIKQRLEAIKTMGSIYADGSDIGSGTYSTDGGDTN